MCLLAQFLFVIITFLRIGIQSIDVTLGDGLTKSVECPAPSNPPLAIIIWTRNLSIINWYNGDQRIYVNKEGKLVFDPAQINDTDLYTCSPYSPFSKQYTVISVSILVKEIPSFLVRPLPFYHKIIGQSLTIPCVASGDPDPQVYWKKVGGNFPSTTKTLHDGGNLTIVHLTKDEQGFYECYAANDISTIVTTTFLIVQGTYKETPYNVGVDVTHNSAKISWLPPYSEDGQKLGYKVWCQEYGSKHWLKFDNIPDPSSSVTIYNLKPLTNYKFVIITQGKSKLKFSSEVYSITKSVVTPRTKYVTSRRSNRRKFNGSFSSIKRFKQDQVLKIKQGIVVSPPRDRHPPLHLGVIGVILCLLLTAVCSVIFYVRKLTRTLCTGNLKTVESTG